MTRATTHRAEFHRRSPVKVFCRAATTASITISTALNNGDTLDGITLATGDRVLVKDQSTGSQNGIYVVGASPARAYDMDTSVEVVGTLILVTEGTANGGKLFRNSNIGSVTLGATSLTFAAVGSGSGTGGRPPFDYVVAASDSAVDLQAIADAVCDGTNDQTEINAAISAAVTAARPYSILLLPGTYYAGAAIDFTPLTASGGKWLVFEASGTTIIAAANLTTMVKLDPGAGGQIVICADIRLGALDGNVGTHTVTQLVSIARFNDNMLRIEDVRNSSGVGVKVAMAGVGDYPCGNNKIDIEIIHSLGGTAFHVTGNVNPNSYGFQGNTVHIGEIIACDNGIVLGTAVNQNANWNLFMCGPIEHNTNAGIYDYCGANTFIVANLNSNGDELGGPTGMTLRSTYLVQIDAAFSGGVTAAVTDQHFVQDSGAFIGVFELVERASAIATPASGYGRVYVKNDGTIHFVNDAGTDYDLTAGGGGVTGFATPAIVLGTAAAAGTATTVIRSDATVAVFDATVPTTQAFGDAAATGSAAKAARRDHLHGMPATPSSGGGFLLIADAHSTPLVFDDILQADDGSGFLYMDP